MLFQANSVPLATDEEPSTTDAVATFRGPWTLLLTEVPSCVYITVKGISVATQKVLNY